MDKLCLSIFAAMKFACDPAFTGIAPLIDDSPGIMAGEAMNIVFLVAIVDGELIGFSIPDKLSIPDSVWEWKEDWNSTACGPSDGVLIGIDIKEIESPGTPFHLPIETIKSEGRPNHQAGIRFTSEEIDSGIQTNLVRLGSACDLKTHNWLTPGTIPGILVG